MKKDPKERIDPLNPLSHFREASWEEALDLAARKLSSIRDSKGGDSALAGFGCAKGSNEEAYLFQKLVRVGFKIIMSTIAPECATHHLLPHLWRLLELVL